MIFSLDIPSVPEKIQLNIETGSTVIFVGANGGGKTRLAVALESAIGVKAHRVSAHRALNLNAQVNKISEDKALNGLRNGNVDHQQRDLFRWKNRSATIILDDFDFLIQALFADQANTSLVTHNNARIGVFSGIRPTKLESLALIWKKLLPHRILHISGDNILVSDRSLTYRYSSADMSDGERAVFYLICQVLVAEESSMLIFDEPELHIHRSIMARLWDELEAARPDCAFVLITHDLEFASSRIGQKFMIYDYEPSKGWAIEAVPEETDFSEKLTTLILGSRKPILFVEGANTSLDKMIYRACYPEWTVIPRNSCEQVIHSVVTMRANQALTRVTCSGIVDADDFDTIDASNLARHGVSILPVSEIENLFLLPDVSQAIAENEGFSGSELIERLATLKESVFGKINQPGAIDEVVARHCRRRIDRALKKIDLSSALTVEEINTELGKLTSALNVASIADIATTRIRRALATDNLPLLLACYDNKGLMSVTASILKNTTVKNFESWLSRVLKNDTVPNLTTALRGHLPPLAAQ